MAQLRAPELEKLKQKWRCENQGWRRRNPQPHWYHMRVPQFIDGTCVVCYKEKYQCIQTFAPSILTRKHFHRAPFVMTDIDPPIFSYSTIQIPEHRWFHEWNARGRFKYEFYEEAQTTRTEPMTPQQEFRFVNQLIQKWTVLSPKYLRGKLEDETLAAVAELWGPSPALIQRIDDFLDYKRSSKVWVPVFIESVIVNPEKPEDPPKTLHEAFRRYRRKVFTSGTSSSSSHANPHPPPTTKGKMTTGSPSSAEELTESDFDRPLTEVELTEERTAMEED